VDESEWIRKQDFEHHGRAKEGSAGAWIEVLAEGMKESKRPPRRIQGSTRFIPVRRDSLPRESRSAGSSAAEQSESAALDEKR